MSKRRRGRSSGNKFKMSLGLPVITTMNYTDNTDSKNLYIFPWRESRAASINCRQLVLETWWCLCQEKKPDLWKVLFIVIVRQRKPWRWKDGFYMYFEDTVGVIVNPKGEMKGSAVTSPIGKECVDLCPRMQLPPIPLKLK